MGKTPKRWQSAMLDIIRGIGGLEFVREAQAGGAIAYPLSTWRR